jgi:hypothetical protein
MGARAADPPQPKLTCHEGTREHQTTRHAACRHHLIIPSGRFISVADGHAESDGEPGHPRERLASHESQGATQSRASRTGR